MGGGGGGRLRGVRRLYLARHGDTDWNAIGKLQGASDIPLNATGRTQALALGGLLREEGIGFVATSDLVRARETGAIAAAALAVVDIGLDPELRERSFGVFEGLTRAELESHHPEAWEAWRLRSIAPSSAEQTELVVARMKRSLLRLFERDGGAALIVSHGAAMRLVMNDLTGTTLGPIANGAVYTLERSPSNSSSGGEDIGHEAQGTSWTIAQWERPPTAKA